jgi:BlaI family penicillinase repressor
MHNLTPAELEIMTVLWDAEGPLKPSVIEERLGGGKANTTVRTLLTILLRKGHVARKKDGKAYLYSATTRREAPLPGLLRRLIEGYCGGSASLLMQHLVKSEDLSESDLRELKKLASQRLKDKEAKQ